MADTTQGRGLLATLQAVFTALLAPLVALGLLRGPPAPTPEASSAVAAETRQEAEPSTTAVASGPKVDDAKRRIQEACRAQLDAQLDASGRRGERPIRTLIVTLPDPIETGYRYLYDSALSGVDAAAQRAGYLADELWMPWADDRKLPDAPTSTYEACRTYVPGVRWFRGQAAWLRVLVVGETPTWGVEVEALKVALDRAEENPPHVHIVGPFFSGSAESMRWVLSRHGPKEHVWVVTGSATGRDVGSTLARVATFKATAPRDDELQCTFLRYLYRRGNSTPPDQSRVFTVARTALLHETGTEYGASSDDRGTAGVETCPYRPEVDLRFPAGVAAVRDQYSKEPQTQEAVARRTYLDLKFRENDARLELGGGASGRTTIARDLVLANLLSEISREGIRVVMLQATDVADSIFLGRKIRDVAADVRLAFFSSDVLLLHPTLRGELLGSYVVGPYPFFGSDDFTPRRDDHRSAGDGDAHPHHHAPFMNAVEEGVFNAVVAQLGVDPSEPDDLEWPTADAVRGSNRLEEYSLFRTRRAGGEPGGDRYPPPLPTWISAIASDDIVPVTVRAAEDCGHLLIGHDDAHRAPSAGSFDAICDTTKSMRAVEELRWDRNSARMRDYGLGVDPDVTPPNIWLFVLGLVAILALHDWRTERRLNGVMDDLDVEQRIFKRLEDSDKVLDLALCRTEYALYRSLRRASFVFALGYMVVVQRVAIATYVSGDAHVVPRLILAAGAAALVVQLLVTGSGVRRFTRQFRLVSRYLARPDVQQARALERRAPARHRSAVDRVWSMVVRAVGFETPRGRAEAVTQSLTHLRWLALLSTSVFACAALLVLRDLQHAGLNWVVLLGAEQPTPAATVFVLRTLPLLNGVAPAAPILLCTAACYVWARGRMGRLCTAQTLTLLSPSGAATAAVCAPLTFVAEPDRALRTASGLARVEADLANAMWRPLTGPTALFTTVGTFTIPVLISLLKPPSSLETEVGTWTLYGMLGVVSIICVGTLAQLAQYGALLHRLLNRLLPTAAARGLRGVHPRLRESIEQQISVTGSDLLKLQACARSYEDAAGEPPKCAPIAPAPSPPDDVHAEVRRIAGALAEDHAVTELTEGAMAGPMLLDAAQFVASGLPRDEPPDAPEKASLHQRFVATVIALMLNRHVRQIRSYFYSLIGCSACLLLGVWLYAFQPKRVLLSAVLVVLVGAVATMLTVYIALERHPVMSRIANTTEGSVDLDASLVARFVKWGAIPLVAIAAVQYPQLANTLSGWLVPLKLLK